MGTFKKIPKHRTFVKETSEKFGAILPSYVQTIISTAMLVTTIHGMLAAEQLPTRTYAALSAAFAPVQLIQRVPLGSYHGILQRTHKKNTDI